MHVCDVPLVLIFYVLLRPVSRNLALLAVLFDLVQTASTGRQQVESLGGIISIGKRRISEGIRTQSAARPVVSCYQVACLRFWGGPCIFWLCVPGCGYLILRSGYLPRAIGVLMQIAGECYLVNSFALLSLPHSQT